MNQAEFEKKHLDSLLFWEEQGLIDLGVFTEWLWKQHIEVLKIMYKAFEKKQALDHCYIVESILEIKKLSIVKKLSIIKKEQFN